MVPGAWGNNERFAIRYYQPRVAFRRFSSNLIMPLECRGDQDAQAFEATMITATSTPPAKATRLNFFFSCSALGKRCVAPT